VKLRLLVIGALLALAAAFLASGGLEVLTFENLKARQHDIDALFRREPWLTLGGFFLAYTVVAATSVPGGAALTLLAGAVFGAATATVVVSFASTLGATFAFLVSRHLARGWVERRFGDRVVQLNEGIRREGALYLFLVRLVPLIPFFLVNAGMGLRRMRTWTSYWVSQIGMLPGSLLFANAGARLAEMRTPADALSPGVIGAFVLLGVLPLAAKKALDAVRRRRNSGSGRNSGTG